MCVNDMSRRAVIVAEYSRFSLLVALLLIVGCTRNPQEGRDPGSQGTRVESESACGTVGDIVLKLPSRNAFIGMVYEGEDYWTGNGEKDWGGKCHDRLLEASIALTLPGMVAEHAPPSLPSNRGGEMVVLTVRSGNAGAKEEGREGLNREAVRAIDFKQDESDWESITQSKKWDPSLGLYCMPGKSEKTNREVCWSERVDGSVDSLVICNRRPEVGPALCTQRFLKPDGNVMVEIGYQGEVRTRWKSIEEFSRKFIDDNATSAKRMP